MKEQCEYNYDRRASHKKRPKRTTIGASGSKAPTNILPKVRTIKDRNNVVVAIFVTFLFVMCTYW